MGLLTELLRHWGLERQLAIFALICARWLPLTALAPFFAPRGLPAAARLGLALTLSALVFPAAASAAGPLPPTGLQWAALVLRELLVGALLGLLVALPFYALASGGQLIDSARGARMAELLGTPTPVRASPTGTLLLLMGVVCFLAIDGHLLVISAVAESYRSLPVGAELPAAAPAQLAALVAHLGSRFFLVALGLAAPAIAVLLLLELALGLAGRLAPTLPLYFLGLPLKALGGPAVLLLTLSALLGTFGSVYRLALWGLDAGLRALGG